MNKKYEYDLVVYIGRFQPFHNGHRETVRFASTISKNVLVLIGSANGPRTIRNPWTYEERVDSIVDSTQLENLFFGGLNDYSYNDNKWIQQVGNEVAIIQELIMKSQEEYNPVFRKLGNKEFKVAVIGHDKDHTSYYLNYFPQWKYVEMKAYPSESETIDSTKVRQLMFTGQVSFTDGVMPSNQVRDFMQTEEFTDLQKEWDYIEAYKKSWEVAPYESTFVTVDAVVEQSGHVMQW